MPPRSREEERTASRSVGRESRSGSSNEKRFASTPKFVDGTTEDAAGGSDDGVNPIWADMRDCSGIGEPKRTGIGRFVGRARAGDRYIRPFPEPLLVIGGSDVAVPEPQLIP